MGLGAVRQLDAGLIPRVLRRDAVAYPAIHVLRRQANLAAGKCSIYRGAAVDAVLITAIASAER